MKDGIAGLFLRKDARWTLLWCAGVLFVWTWDYFFLNRPAFIKVTSGFANTVVIAALVVVFTLVLGWFATLLLHSLRRHPKGRPAYLFVTFSFNLIRSIPQIVGILFAYIGITALIGKGIVDSKPVIFILMAFSMSAFIFLEVVDLMRERIEHYSKLDFYSAMRVCGISERRIVNFDILWKNSRLHIFNKLIAVLGYAVFLQCSVDFIISVGLSTDVNDMMLPTTLGSLLAKIDSKQDILMIGHTLTDPSYIGHLFFEHLQGMTVAFLIVFSLVSIYHIANGFAERHRL